MPRLPRLPMLPVLAKRLWLLRVRAKPATWLREVGDRSPLPVLDSTTPDSSRSMCPCDRDPKLMRPADRLPMRRMRPCSVPRSSSEPPLAPARPRRERLPMRLDREPMDALDRPDSGRGCTRRPRDSVRCRGLLPNSAVLAGESPTRDLDLLSACRPDMSVRPPGPAASPPSAAAGPSLALGRPRLATRARVCTRANMVARRLFVRSVPAGVIFIGLSGDRMGDPGALASYPANWLGSSPAATAAFAAAVAAATARFFSRAFLPASFQLLTMAARVASFTMALSRRCTSSLRRASHSACRLRRAMRVAFKLRTAVSSRRRLTRLVTGFAKRTFIMAIMRSTMRLRAVTRRARRGCPCAPPVLLRCAASSLKARPAVGRSTSSSVEVAPTSAPSKLPSRMARKRFRMTKLPRTTRATMYTTPTTPVARQALYMREGQSSPVSTWKMATDAHSRESKLDRGTSASRYPSSPMTRAVRDLGWNRKRFANSCSPMRAKMKMNSSSRTEKLATSASVLVMAFRSTRREVHERASLNTRKSRNVRRAEMPPPPSVSASPPTRKEGGLRPSSSRDTSTMNASKMLKASET